MHEDYEGFGEAQKSLFRFLLWSKGVGGFGNQVKGKKFPLYMVLDLSRYVFSTGSLFMSVSSNAEEKKHW